MAVELNTVQHDPAGAERHPPLMIAHGLFGSARNFHSMGKKLAQNRRVILVDMRNHGASPWDDDVSYACHGIAISHRPCIDQRRTAARWCSATRWAARPRWHWR